MCVTLAKLSDGIPINRLREMAIHTISELNEGINPNEEAKKRAKEADIASLTLREAFEVYYSVTTFIDMTMITKSPLGNLIGLGWLFVWAIMAGINQSRREEAIAEMLKL